MNPILVSVILEALERMLENWDPAIYEDELDLTIGDVAEFMRELKGLSAKKQPSLSRDDREIAPQLWPSSDVPRVALSDPGAYKALLNRLMATEEMMRTFITGFYGVDLPDLGRGSGDTGAVDESDNKLAPDDSSEKGG